MAPLLAEVLAELAEDRRDRREIRRILSSLSASSEKREERKEEAGQEAAPTAAEPAAAGSGPAPTFCELLAVGDRAEAEAGRSGPPSVLVLLRVAGRGRLSEKQLGWLAGRVAKGLPVNVLAPVLAAERNGRDLRPVLEQAGKIAGSFELALRGCTGHQGSGPGGGASPADRALLERFGTPEQIAAARRMGVKVGAVQAVEDAGDPVGQPAAGSAAAAQTESNANAADADGGDPSEDSPAATTPGVGAVVVGFDDPFMRRLWLDTARRATDSDLVGAAREALARVPPDCGRGELLARFGRMCREDVQGRRGE